MMKVQVRHIIRVFLLMLGISFSSQAYSQTNPPTPTCAICGGKNGVHATTCKYYNPPSGRAQSQSSSMPGNMQQLNSLIDLFSSPAVNDRTQADRDAAIKAAKEAKQQAELLKKERHDEAMKTFKPLDGDPGAVHSDKESGSGLTLKPLPSASAPMTREERERQNLLKHVASVTWNYGEFSPIASDNRIPEPAPRRELTEHEKLINDIIGTVESNGGRVAAITGRYIVNVKDGVMDYLDDAAYAVTSGNSALMQETGEFDVRKITTNAIYKTASQTAKAYYENAKADLTGSLKDQSIGIMKNATINKLEEYKYSASLASAWRQTH